MSTESSNTRTWTAKKKWIAGAGIIIALLCILTIASKFYVEKEIRDQLLLVGERLTGRRLTVDSVIYHPLTWETVIQNVEMPNPEGYSSRNPAVSVKNIHIVIAPWAVLQKLVHIRSLRVDGVTLYPEVKKIPFSFDDLLAMIMNPEINLVDIERMGWYTPGKRKNTDKPLWYLRIDDFSVTSVQIQFVNVRRLKDKIPFLPKFVSEWMPDTLNLSDYQQQDLGVDGKNERLVQKRKSQMIQKRRVPSNR